MKQTVSGNIKCFDISCSDKDIEKSMNRKSILDTILEEKDKEIERLNNIINELEKYIDDNYFYDDVGMKIFDVSLLEDKIKELKESVNNE